MPHPSSLSTSHNLSTSDVSRIVGLFRDLHEIQRARGNAHQHLAVTLAEITGARTCAVGHRLASPLTSRAHWAVRGRVGWLSPQDLALLGEAEKDPEFSWLITERMLALPKSQRTLRRDELVTEAEFFASQRYAELYKEIGWGDVIVAKRPVPGMPALCSWISLIRPHGDAGFSERDAAIVDLVHSELWPELLSPRGALSDGSS